MKWRFVFLGVLVMASCQGHATGPTDVSQYWGGPDISAVDARLITANNRFAFKLFAELAGDSATENVFISPTSIATALAMTYNGAAGETQRAMARALQLDGMSSDDLNAASEVLRMTLANPEPEVQIDIANSLWARAGIPFVESFLEKNRRHFAAEITALDFSRPDAAGTINAWVAGKTRGRIPTIVSPPISSMSILFLINAIYFKGTWTHAFDPAMTNDGKFRRPDGSTVSVPMMFQGDTLSYARGDGFEAVRLPYGSGRLGMYLFLPDRQSNLQTFISGLDNESWQQWLSGFAPTRCDVLLPRFTLKYEQGLRKALSALGMEVAFSGNADFTAMTRLPVQISRVRHKTFLQVNEEGSEAAAVTSVEMGVTVREPAYPILVCNRPFFCAIVDNTSGAILFMGTVADPQS